MTYDRQSSPIDREPLVIEKHRHRLEGISSSVVFYACGPARDTREEAEQDARVFHRMQKLAAALKLIEDSAPPAAETPR